MTTIWKQAYAVVDAGWYQGSSEWEGCYCAGGALAKVITGEAGKLYEYHNYPELNQALSTLADYVGAPTAYSWTDHLTDELVYEEFSPCDRVIGWNDNTGRKKEEVLRVLDELHTIEVSG